MWDAGDRHYYVNELCRLKNGHYVIPVRWLAKTHANGSKSYYADAFHVTFDEMVSLVYEINVSIIVWCFVVEDIATVQDDNVILIATNELGSNFYDLEHETLIPKWSGECIKNMILHCLH